MNELKTYSIRAVLAALFLSIALTLVLISSRSPLGPLRGVGDTYLLLHGPLALESRLLQSDIKSRLENSPEGTRLISNVLLWRDRLRSELGPVYNFVGWNLRTAVALRPEGPPVVAINPGVLSPFGSYLFHRAGFQNTTLANESVLQKGEMVMAGAGGFWIIGEPDGIKTALEADRNPTFARDRERLKNLLSDADSRATINILVLPAGINRHVSRIYSEKTALVLEDWAAVSSWDGLVVSLSANRKKMFISGTLLEENSPLPALFRQFAKSPGFSDWFPPETLDACRLGVPRPLNLLRDAKNTYHDRQGPRDILDRIEIELAQELGIKLDELADTLRDEIGFVNFNVKGKPHTILIADVRSGSDKYFAKLEKGISPAEWKAVLGTHEIRYLKRLLAYSLVNRKLIIATDPDTLSAYIESIKKNEAPDDMVALADHYSYAPLIVVGSLFGEGPKSTQESSILEDNGPWYGIAVEKKGKKLGVQMSIMGKMGPNWGPPWGIRFLMWSFWLIKLVMYIIIVVALSNLAFSTAQIYRTYRA